MRHSWLFGLLYETAFHADWTGPQWSVLVNDHYAYANINYSLQVVRGGLITIG